MIKTTPIKTDELGRVVLSETKHTAPGFDPDLSIFITIEYWGDTEIEKYIKTVNQYFNRTSIKYYYENGNVRRTETWYNEEQPQSFVEYNEYGLATLNGVLQNDGTYLEWHCEYTEDGKRRIRAWNTANDFEEKWRYREEDGQLEGFLVTSDRVVSRTIFEYDENGVLIQVIEAKSLKDDNKPYEKSMDFIEYAYKGMAYDAPWFDDFEAALKENQDGDK